MGGMTEGEIWLVSTREKYNNDQLFFLFYLALINVRSISYVDLVCSSSIHYDIL